MERTKERIKLETEMLRFIMVAMVALGGRFHFFAAGRVDVLSFDLGRLRADRYIGIKFGKLETVSADHGAH